MAHFSTHWTLAWLPRRDIIPYSKWLVSLQEVYVHILDLSETKKVGEFAEAFKKKYKALNVLVSNTSYLFFIFGNIWQCVSHKTDWLCVDQ